MSPASSSPNLTRLANGLSEAHAAKARFRQEVGRLKFGLLAVAVNLLAAPRLLVQLLSGRRSQAPDRQFQVPWLPHWPGLSARALHDARDHPWLEIVRAAQPEILAELLAVQQSFLLARYASDQNTKPWTTYYFFLEGRPVAEHLAACPRTADVLSKVPHNGFHVCFSAIEPGGSLVPHTGPTNASLTAHLGLLDCSGARLFVPGASVEYRDGEAFVFDDSFLHWVEHAGPRTRYSLMITFWHPQLSDLERVFLGWIVRLAPR